MSAQNVKLYYGVIEEVINGVRDLFLDEGVDEQVLQELKQTWEKKLHETKAIDYSDKYSEIGSSSLSANSRLTNQGSNSAPRSQNSSRNTNATREVNQQATSLTVIQTDFMAAPLTSNSGNSGSSRDHHLVQLDGDGSSEDDEDDEDDFRENEDHEDNDDDQNDDEHENTGEEEEPLNSEDDVSDEDPHELFDTDNVVVCQYDKITRSRNKWKFYLKDGIMNLQGKDYVFQKAIGDAEW